MGKMELIKTKLASLLIEVKCETIKTNMAVLEYDGELAEGTAVYVTDAETEERTPAADGEYITEDNKVITVAEGKVVSIVEKEEEPEETPAEDAPAEEEVAAEEIVEDAPAEEVAEETPAEEEKDDVAELKARVEALEATVAELTSAIETLKTETLSKLSMSAAKPITEEFEQVKVVKATGNSKVDRFIERYGNK